MAPALTPAVAPHVTPAGSTLSVREERAPSSSLLAGLLSPSAAPSGGGLGLGAALGALLRELHGRVAAEGRALMAGHRADQLALAAVWAAVGRGGVVWVNGGYVMERVMYMGSGRRAVDTLAREGASGGRWARGRGVRLSRHVHVPTYTAVLRHDYVGSLLGADGQPRRTAGARTHCPGRCRTASSHNAARWRRLRRGR